MLAYCFADESAEVARLLKQGLLTPQRDWTPEQVVEIQVRALQASGADPLAVADCFALASPENRLVTGPIDRFAKMIASPAYRPLTECKSYQVGQAVVHDRHAHVLVTLVDKQGKLNAYRFMLSQQEEPEAADCWMTDAVLRALPRGLEPGS